MQHADVCTLWVVTGMQLKWIAVPKREDTQVSIHISKKHPTLKSKYTDSNISLTQLILLHMHNMYPWLHVSKTAHLINVKTWNWKCACILVHTNELQSHQRTTLFQNHQEEHDGSELQLAIRIYQVPMCSTNLANINNDWIVSSNMICPIFIRNFFIWSSISISGIYVRSMFHTIQVLMESIQEECQKLLWIMLVVSTELRCKPRKLHFEWSRRNWATSSRSPEFSQ